MVPEGLSLSLLYGLLKDAAGFVRRGLKRPAPQEMLAHRLRIKQEVMRAFRPISKSYTPEAIVRDVKRMDSYPTVGDKKGISPWFKVEVRGLYYRGLECIVRIESLAYDAGSRSWRVAPSSHGDTTVAYVVGRIPFDNIHDVDPGGDEYYSIPHVYCSYAYGGQPWEAYKYYWERSEGNRITFVPVKLAGRPERGNWFSLFRRGPEA